jgi:tetratricopeptide (TPR) repeat protein
MKRLVFFVLVSLAAVALITGSPVYADSAKELNRTANYHNLHGDFEKALDLYNQVLEIEPNNTWAMRNKAFDLGNLQRWDEALPAIDIALKAWPGDSDLLRAKGYALMKVQRNEEAIDTYKQLITTCGDCGNRSKSSMWFDIGTSLNSLGRYSEAIEAFDEGFRLDPKEVRILNEKGVLLMNLSRYEEAVQTFDQALKINSLYGNAKENRKIAESKLGK